MTTEIKYRLLWISVGQYKYRKTSMLKATVPCAANAFLTLLGALGVALTWRCDPQVSMPQPTFIRHES